MIRPLVVALAVCTGCGKSSKPAVVRDGGARGANDAPARIDAAPVREVGNLRQELVDVVAPGGEHAPAKDAVVARLSRLGDGAVADASAVPAGWAGRFGTVLAAPSARAGTSFGTGAARDDESRHMIGVVD